ncbi:hypothetical protein LTR78_010706 [Recurvomyces mirabilis]|uniref:Uncharacterized protein n=1 Tax=Recurvomyces mirabilis TaxID=574656 RepID=A0AAE0TP93_9PEZI|nr:hypothetical protein LTR78_010706 [Recurvomyces mirabilis]KAK5159608.1 hypothetical protein LTS14_002750 [Recurvomyces mirabilis]
MPGSLAAAALAAAIATLPLVSAHGYVASATISGTAYFVGNPNWAYQTPTPKQPGWYANNLDNGFVSPASYGTADIICHKAATPGSTALTIAAGSTMQIQWNTWPDSHKGPVSNMLAAVSGDFSSISKGSLKWFEAEVGALQDDSSPPGQWSTDKLIANNFTAPFTVPAGLAAGNYVLRHEIIGLHAAGSSNGAQSYPMCINLVVTGSGTTNPCAASGADCRIGTSLYTETDPGILIDIYSPISAYKIPGPALISGGKFDGNIGGPPGGSGSAPASSAQASSATSKAATTLVTSTKATSVAPTTKAPTSVPATSTKAAAPTSSASTGTCAAKYAQCGGQGWTGATCCVSGSKSFA